MRPGLMPCALLLCNERRLLAMVACLGLEHDVTLKTRMNQCPLCFLPLSNQFKQVAKQALELEEIISFYGKFSKKLLPSWTLLCLAWWKLTKSGSSACWYSIAYYCQSS